MNIRIVGWIAILFGSASFADDSADRAKLAGTWQLEAQGGSGAGSVWILEEKGDTIHVTRMQGDQKLAEFECNAAGRECDVKDSGRPVKVSLYFNGAALVELETRGSEVVKRRFSAAGAGDAMEIQVIPLVPDGKPETLHFKRMQTSASGK